MIDWSQIEKYYDQGNTSGFALSILESEKIFRKVIEEKRFPGRNLEDKVFLAKKHLSAPQFFDQARNLVLQILALNLPKNIGKQTAEQILRTYFTAISELEAVSSSEVARDRLFFTFSKIKKLLSKSIFYFLIIAILTILTTLFISETAWGQTFAQKLVDWAHLIVFRAVPAAFIIVTIVIIGIGLSLRKKNHATRSIKPTTLHEHQNRSEEIR